MKVLILYAHPNPSSFNRAILERVEETLNDEGHEFRTLDLYARDDKVRLDAQDLATIKSGEMPPDIRELQQEVLWADALAFIYPVWWFGMPAVLKGWIDRVFQEGFAFRFGADGMSGLLGPRRALVIHTTGGDYQAHVDMNGLDLLSRPLVEGVLGFCGLGPVHYLPLFGVPVIGNGERLHMLDQVRDITRRLLRDESPAH